jgi:hypothetical protein
MVLVKTSGTDVHFPVIGWFSDGARTFSEREDLLFCPSVFYENNDLIGIELVDNSLRGWVIRSVDLCSPLPKERFWQNRWIFFLFLPVTFFMAVASNYTVEIDPILEEIGTLDLEEIKGRLLREKELFWAGLDPVESPEYQVRVAEMRAARDVASLVKILEKDWPAGLFD